jgi:PAS domain S-box-containing protein
MDASFASLAGNRNEENPLTELQRLRTMLDASEAAVRQSEARLALLFDSVTDFQVLYRVEPGHRFVTAAVNRALVEYFQATVGKKALDYVGRDFEEILAATGLTHQEIEQRRALFRRSVEEKAPVRYDTPPAALREAAEAQITPVLDENGCCTHLLWNGRRITERIRSEAALRESEERYTLVTEATHDGIFDWNLATGSSHLSPRFKQILGFRDDELPNDLFLFFDRIHPQDVGWLHEVVDQIRIGGTMEMFEHEVRLRANDGGYRWVVSRGRVVRDDKRRPRRIVGAIHDITERKLAEADQAFLASIVESSNDSIVATSLDGTILSWNAASERFWGYTSGEAIGKHIRILFPAGHDQQYESYAERIKRGEPIEQFETVRVRKDGTLVVVSVIKSPIMDAHGILSGVSTIYRDITARKTADAQLLVAKQVAEVASRAKSEFLANMTHEIRTPMNGIIGLTEVVLDSELNPEQREYLNLVKTSADSLLKIITDILDISRIQAGKVVLRPKEFWIRNMVANTINGFAPAARGKNLQLTFHVQPEIPEILLGDSGCLKQVLEHLVDNAIKFTAAGEVTVSVEGSPGSLDHLHFWVRDTGIGIAADKQQTIFEPFSQADNSSRRQFGGTGLGLAIAAQLVEILGGRIWVESDGRNGCTLHFTARMEPAGATSLEASGAERLETVDERRREPRRPLDELASLKVLEPSLLAPCDVRILDASKGGFKLSTGTPVAPGSIVEIQRAGAPVTAEVRFCVPIGAAFHIGVKLMPPPSTSPLFPSVLQ